MKSLFSHSVTKSILALGITGILIFGLIFFVQNSEHIQGYLKITKTTPSGIGISFEKYVLPTMNADGTGKVNMEFRLSGATTTNSFQGFSVALGNLPINDIQNVTVTKSSLIPSNWITDGNLNGNVYTVAYVGTQSVTTDGLLATVSFDTKSTFNAALIDLSGYIVITKATGDERQDLSNDQITLKKPSTITMNYTNALANGKGEIIVKANNLSDTKKIQLIEAEVTDIVGGATNITFEKFGATDANTWTADYNNQITPIRASFGGNPAIGSNTLTSTDIFKIKYDYTGTGSNIAMKLALRFTMADGTFEFPITANVGTQGSSNTCPLRADINLDGNVDIKDFNYIMIKWRKSGADIVSNITDLKTPSRIDIVQDSVVDIRDFNVLLNQWAQNCPVTN